MGLVAMGLVDSAVIGSQRLAAHGAMVPRLAPGAAVMAVGADEHVPAGIVEHDLVEIAVRSAAQAAGLIPMLDVEGMVLEIQADHPCVGRDGVDPLLAPGA